MRYGLYEGLGGIMRDRAEKVIEAEPKAERG